MKDDRRRRRHPHRGRRRKKKKGSILTKIVLIVSLVIFFVSGFQLFKIAKGYLDGRGEYEDMQELAITSGEPEGGFRVDFGALKEVNEDTVGWIRFYPEPAIINYPVVQGTDNDKYLTKTFSNNENTLGTIFVDVINSPVFEDANTIIYGHRMKDGSMFRKLEEYKDKSFWEENPYFYIYTPDGHELTYKIYSVGTIKDTSDSYLTQFATVEEHQTFINLTKQECDYDTGVEVTTEDKIVTLSTCTARSDDHRFVVRGVLEKDVKLQEK